MNKTFSFGLEWDTLSIQKAIGDHLEDLKWKIETSLEFADSGESALIITAYKKKNAIIIQLENENKKIVIQAGIQGKYLPTGKQIPKYSKVFSSEKIQDASKFFEKIMEDLK